MSIRIARVLCLVSAGISASSGASDIPLRDGERITYRVSWAILRGAGEITVEARRDLGADDRLLISTTTRTRFLARLLMQFDARGDALFDRSNGLLHSLHESSNKRGRKLEHLVEFDHASRTATYRPLVPAGDSRPLAMPPGNPLDLILALFQTRHWNLQPGQTRDTLVLFDDDFYELTLHVLGNETVRTPLGTFNTSVIEPRMDKTAPKGMFRRGSTVRVWIADGDLRLPVRFAVEFNIGTGVATIESYRVPTSDASTRPLPTDAPDSHP